jgi:hypothetical protein
MKTLKNFPAIALFSLCTVSVSSALSASDVAWLQVGADGGYVIKAITTSSACPELTVDGGVAPTWETRGSPDIDFPGLVCEANMPAAAWRTSVANQPLPTPVANPQRIVVLGDTGCRIKAKNGKIKSQDCNDPLAWPFAQLAQAAANWQPELVIHVGDYHYREADCPAANQRCEGSVSGDRWTSWDQDFFTPAKPLLRAAPWIFVRGNHELCDRGGRGWFKFLDLGPYSGACKDDTPPYSVAIGDHRAVVLDSADDGNIQPSLGQLKVENNRLIWLLSHRPFLTAGADDEEDDPVGKTSTFPDTLKGAVSVVFSGHQHHLSLNHFPDWRPPELISGNGGTKLKAPEDEDPKLVAAEYSDFGFLTLERGAAQSWKLTERDRDGKAVFTCNLVEALNSSAVLTCSP